MSEITKTYENGNVTISAEAFASIATVVAKEVPDIVSISAGLISDIAGKITKKSSFLPVKVDIVDENINIEVHTVLKYGSNIPKIAAELQDRIASAVENMTGISVKTVNVVVDNVVVEKKNDKKEKEENKDA